MELKEKIKFLCCKNNISMNQLESELGFGKGYLSKLGNSSPNIYNLKKIADYFHVTLDYLVTDIKCKENSYRINEINGIANKISESKELKLLFNSLCNATPDDLKTFYFILLALQRKGSGNSDEGC